MKYAIITFAVFMIIASMLIGWYAQRKSQGVQAFFGGTAMFGPVVIGLSSMAAVASAFAVVGIPGLVYAGGNSMGLWMMTSFGFAMCYIVLGKKMRAMAELGPVATLGDVVDLRYGKGMYIKLITSITLFIGSIAYLTSQIKGVSEMFAHLMGWEPMTVGLIVFGSLTVYMIISGEVGGLMTQAFQGLIMVIAAIIMMFALFWTTGGMGEVTAAVSTAGTVTAGGYTKAMTPNLMNGWGILPGAVVFTYMLIPSIGVLGQPSILTRMYSLKDPLEMPRVAVWSACTHWCMTTFTVFTGFGALYLVAKGFIAPLSGPDRATFAVADYIGPSAQFFVYAATLAAAMSSASMFLSLAGSILARDIPSALGRPFTPEKQILISRVVMGIVGVLAVYIAINSAQLVAILGTFGYGTFVSVTYPVFIIGLLWDRCSSQGAFAGAATALGMTCVCLLLNQAGFVWPGGIPWYAVAVAASISITVFVSLVTNGASGPNLTEKVRQVIDL